MTAPSFEWIVVGELGYVIFLVWHGVYGVGGDVVRELDDITEALTPPPPTADDVHNELVRQLAALRERQAGE